MGHGYSTNEGAWNFKSLIEETPDLDTDQHYSGIDLVSFCEPQKGELQNTRSVAQSDNFEKKTTESIKFYNTKSDTPERKDGQGSVPEESAVDSSYEHIEKDSSEESHNSISGI